MYAKTTEIRNTTGLHARPCAEFVAKAKTFASNITIRKADAPSAVNAKSMVLVMTQGFNKGTVVELGAEGADEVQAVDTLVALIESGFGEL